MFSVTPTIPRGTSLFDRNCWPQYTQMPGSLFIQFNLHKDPFYTIGLFVNDHHYKENVFPVMYETFTTWVSKKSLDGSKEDISYIIHQLRMTRLMSIQHCSIYKLNYDLLFRNVYQHVEQQTLILFFFYGANRKNLHEPAYRKSELGV